MTKNYLWRIVNNGAIYVDSNSGDDIAGTGTKDSPFQTLGRAYRGSITKPGTIICRGYFSEDMADGNQSCTIQGEYPGAAIFDGKDTYTLYGFTTHNMVIMNCAPGRADMTVFTGLNNQSPLFAGVGRAGAGRVGDASHANSFPGFAGSNNIVKNCGHYWGHIGGQGSGNVIANPKHNDTYPLFLWGNTNSYRWCIHGIKKEDRTTNKNSTATGNNFFKSIFTDVAFYINDHITFNYCYFGSDCTWWDNKTGEQIILEGETSEEKIAFLKAKMQELGAANTNCTLNDCVFLDKTASEIYNNHELGDFTLKLDTEIPADTGTFGAALNIGIKEASELGEEGVSSMWDPGSAVNNLTIEDGQIVLADEEGETIEESAIYTGVIDIDVNKYDIKSLFTEISSKFDKHISVSEKKDIVGQSYNAGDTLPIGKYIVKGDINYGEFQLTDGDILTVAEEDQTFSDNSEDSKVIELVDPNIEVLTYIRRFSTITYIQEGTSIDLEDGKVYLVMEAPEDTALSSGRKLYKGSIVDGADGVSVKASSSLKLGTLNTTNSDWCPLQLWGDISIARNGGEILKDSEGVPLSSGNYNCYNVGTSPSLKNYSYLPLKYRYQQFKIVARKVC